MANAALAPSAAATIASCTSCDASPATYRPGTPDSSFRPVTTAPLRLRRHPSFTARGEPRLRGDLVLDTGGQQQPPASARLARFEGHFEDAIAQAGVGGLRFADVHAVARQFLAALLSQLPGVDAVAGQVAVQPQRPGVARRARVAHEHPPAATAQQEGGAQTRRPGPEYEDVPDVFCHRRRRGVLQEDRQGGAVPVLRGPFPRDTRCLETGHGCLAVFLRKLQN